MVETWLDVPPSMKNYRHIHVAQHASNNLFVLLSASTSTSNIFVLLILYYINISYYRVLDL